MDMIDIAPEGETLETCAGVLQEVFGYDAFRGPQAQIVSHVSDGGDALVLMPTGGGKSLCYQVPAIVRARAGLGLTVVVSPLIALMHDQVGALLEAGVAAAFLNSSLSMEDAQRVEKDMLRGDITLLYAAPERLTTPRFLALLDSLHERGKLSLFAIDEAHCVSQWGHDFRPEYRGLVVLHERFADVPRVALTATADDLTRADIVERLQLRRRAHFRQQFRPAQHPLHHRREKGRHAATAAFHPRRTHQRPGHDAGWSIASRASGWKKWRACCKRQGSTPCRTTRGLDAAKRQNHQDRFLREEA
ncbi:MAG: RecQ family ATP-dependent DNA helicase [Burkholderiaceae bacterium]